MVWGVLGVQFQTSSDELDESDESDQRADTGYSTPDV